MNQSSIEKLKPDTILRFRKEDVLNLLIQAFLKFCEARVEFKEIKNACLVKYEHSERCYEEIQRKIKKGFWQQFLFIILENAEKLISDVDKIGDVVNREHQVLIKHNLNKHYGNDFTNKDDKILGSKHDLYDQIALEIWNEKLPSKLEGRIRKSCIIFDYLTLYVEDPPKCAYQSNFAKEAIQFWQTPSVDVVHRISNDKKKWSVVINSLTTSAININDIPHEIVIGLAESIKGQSLLAIISHANTLINRAPGENQQIRLHVIPPMEHATSLRAWRSTIEEVIRNGPRTTICFFLVVSENDSIGPELKISLEHLIVKIANDNNPNNQPQG